MTYNPLIPIVTNELTADCVSMQINFSQADTIFANDHFTFDDATVANRGYHRQIYFPTAAIYAANTPPSLGSFAGVTFGMIDGNDSSLRAQLFYKNATGVTQITNRFNNAATNGYVQVAGGIFFMWGFATPASTTSTINFNAIANYSGAPANGFPNNCFSVVCTPADESSPISVSIKASSTTNTKFVVKLSAVPNDGLYWYAIGN
jgi:hypothetical protein